MALETTSGKTGAHGLFEADKSNRQDANAYIYKYTKMCKACRVFYSYVLLL